MSFTTKELLDNIKAEHGLENFGRNEGHYFETPWGLTESVEVFRDRDEPSNYSIIFKVEGDDRFFRFNGYYDSWNGVDWDIYDEFEEVTKKTRVEEYWG